ncbi:hypothetical protein [Micromonospora sp. NBRC 101691]|uniref:hypothetical protein n=1 Tax=Micromonospora sp. NBRC 101691 TaxID=3032198 RepID=UPI0024A55B84|nr:hypothetical protein [Micromonospora sp. NBRC 101691]GLY20980.1 hypothetical protein Misp04_07120 [Micromonospora sp. NBRC 101691]
MAEEPDTPLTIALAEYEHLREASRAIDDQTTARFTFFLTVATAATAVSAGMVTTGTPAGAVRPTLLAGLGALVLMLGSAVFARQVELNARGRRYAVAATVLRTYLARRAPDLAPYLMMPTLDDPGPFAPEPFRRHWARDLVGQAGTIGLINSVVVAVAAGAGLAAVAPGWLAAAGAVAALAGAVATHLLVVRRRVAQSARLVGEVLARRTTLRPADDAVHEPFVRE